MNMNSMQTNRQPFWRKILSCRQLYVLLLPSVIAVFIFSYMPMYGAQIAFRDFSLRKGIWGSEWVGFKHFIRFLTSVNFWMLMKNTLGISIYSLAVGFPVPIILAILLNELRSRKYQRTVQMVTYMPHFISTVAICSMITLFTSLDKGIINQIIMRLGGKQVSFMTEPEWFQTIYVISGIWQEAGWGTIIYMAALSAIDPQMVEAATIDGVNRVQKIWYINLPSIMPTIMILLIMRIGSLVSVGYEKILLLQNDLNMEASDVISTYVYRLGIKNAQYSFTTAIGLFNSVCNIILLLTFNQVAKRLGNSTLF